MADKAAHLTLPRQVVGALIVKFTIKVLYSIHYALMLTRSTLRRLEVPLDANPYGITSLWIVDKFPNISN